MGYVMDKWVLDIDWWVAHTNVDVVVGCGFFLTLALLAWWFCRE